MGGDNFSVRVVSEGREHFEAAVRLAYANAPGGKAGYYISPAPAGNCDTCCGTGKEWRYRNAYIQGIPKKESFEFPCRDCDGSGNIKQRAGMILLWHEDTIGGVEATKLPFELDADAAVGFLWEWLKTVEYPEQPDHDGSNEEGYVVTTGDFWGHVEGSHYAFLGVYPEWLMYGK